MPALRLVVRLALFVVVVVVVVLCWIQGECRVVWHGMEQNVVNEVKRRTTSLGGCGESWPEQQKAVKRAKVKYYLGRSLNNEYTTATMK